MKTFFYILSSFFALHSSAQSFDLKLNLSKGNTYYYTINGTTRIVETVDEKPINIDLALGGKTAFEITDQKDSMYNSTVKYKSIAMNLNAMGKSFVFNSDHYSETDKMSKLLAQLIDLPFSGIMTSRGKIISFSNVDSILTGIIDRFTELSPDRKKAATKQMLESYGQKAFESNFNMFSAMFPPGPVKKDDQWVVTTNLETGMAAVLETTYRLTDITPDWYEIHGSSKIQTANKDAYREVNGMKAKYDLSGTMMTVLRISKITGWIITGTITQKMSGNVKIEDNPKMPGGFTFPMDYTGEIKISGN